MFSALSTLAPSEVDVQDPLVAAQLAEAALREYLALVEDGHGDVEPTHEFHVVLDDDHAQMLSERPEQLRSAGSLLAAHARRRLVEEHHAWLRREHHPDLEPLLLAV